MKPNKLIKSALTITCLAAALACPMGAMAISYDITSDHATGGLGTAPFGTVTLDQIGTSVHVVVDLAAGYSFVATGAADNMDFKFNAVGVALGDITVNQNAIYPLFGATGAFNGDGTGQFAFGITGYTGQHPVGTSQPGGGAGAFSTDIIFDVANATIADLTQPNNLGIIFVADLLAPNGNTGPADVTPGGGQVPDGGLTLALLGSALAGLAVFRRK